MEHVEKLERRIRNLEQSIIKTIHTFERIDNNSCENLTITNPITFFPLVKPTYEMKNIGYEINNFINEDLTITNNIETLISSISFPCCGIWLISYKLQFNLSLGFTSLKYSKITVNEEIENSDYQKMIINDINTINNINHVTTTCHNSSVYTVNENFKINLFVKFTFGKSNISGIFKIISSCIPIFSVIRIG